MALLTKMSRSAVVPNSS